jgi:hypothetical protein
MSRGVLLLLLAAAWPLPAEPAPGVPHVADAQYPTRVDVAGHAFVLHGQGLLRVGGLFRVYSAALYLGEGFTADTALSDVPRRLEVVFVRTIRRDIFADLAAKAMSRYVSRDDMEKLRPLLNQMNALYDDAHRGDRMSLTYIPGRGTELSINGEVKGIVPGADFSAAYFGIWLHPRTLSSSLRASLLRTADAPTRPSSG